MKEVLNVIAVEMANLNINYDFMTWKTKPIPYPYVVGKYFVADASAETGVTELEFWLEAWDRNLSVANLVEIEEKVRKHFNDFRIVQNGTAIAVSYLTGSPELEEDGELKKMQIKLNISYWEGE